MENYYDSDVFIYLKYSYKHRNDPKITDDSQIKANDIVFVRFHDYPWFPGIFKSKNSVYYFGMKQNKPYTQIKPYIHGIEDAQELTANQYLE